MTDKKLTDSEIVKALECCVKSSHFGECFENKCPLVSENGCKVGKETLYPYTLDLINRLQAEKKQWIKEANQYQNWWGEAISRIATAKSEAYKEFAERLNSLIMWSSKKYISITVKDINNLLKEMVGDNETVL